MYGRIWFRNVLSLVVTGIAVVSPAVITPVIAGNTADSSNAPLSLDLLYNPPLTDVLYSDSIKLSLDDAKPFLSSICDKGQVTVGHGYDGHDVPTCVAMSQYPSEACQDGGIELTHVNYGSYSKPGQTEAIVDYAGCEPNANNNGGSILLRQVAGAWRMVSIAPGVRDNLCLKYSQANGVDMLACYYSASHTGVEGGAVSVSRVINEKIIEEPLLYLEAPDIDLACRAARYSTISLLDWTRTLPTGAGAAELALKVMYADVSLADVCPGMMWSPDNEAAYDSKIKKVEHMINMQLKSGVMTYQQQGDKFVVSPESRDIQQTLQRVVAQ